MSNDIQFISVVDSLLVTDFEKVSDTILRVVGAKGFLSAQRVLVNDFAINDFEVVSSRVLLVTLPSAISKLSVGQMEVQVISAELTGTRRVKILLGPTRRTKQISGLQKLVQQVIKEFISRSGSNRFDTNSGGNLLSGLGETLSPSGRSRLANIATQAVTQTRASFLAAQAGERNLASTERLADFRMMGLKYGTSSVEVILRLTTRAGLSLNIPLEV